MRCVRLAWTTRRSSAAKDGAAGYATHARPARQLFAALSAHAPAISPELLPRPSLRVLTDQCKRPRLWKFPLLPECGIGKRPRDTPHNAPNANSIRTTRAV